MQMYARQQFVCLVKVNNWCYLTEIKPNRVNTMRTKLDSPKKWLSLFGLVSALLCSATAQAATDPVITWGPLTPMQYPNQLTRVQLSATANVEGTGGDFGDGFVYSKKVGDVLNAGTTELTATFTPKDTATYNVVTKKVNIVVNPATLIATPQSTTRVYGQDIGSLTGQLLGGEADGITATFLSSATNGSPTGPYSITVQLNDPNKKAGNYNLILQGGTLDITKANLTITVNNAGYSYATAIPTSFTGKVVGNAAVDAIAATFDSEAFSAGPQSSDPASSSIPGDYHLYLKNLTLKNDGNSQAEVVRRGSGGFTNLSNSATWQTPTTGNLLSNYNVSIAVGSLKITNRPVTLTALDQLNVPYGTPASSFTAQWGDENIPNFDVANFTVGFTVGNTVPGVSPDPNDYPIFPYVIDKSQGARLQYYDVTAIPGRLQVVKADYGIMWTSKSPINYGTLLQAGADTPLNAVITHPGTAPIGATNYNPGVGALLDAGPRDITLTVAGTTQYKAATVTRTITVNPVTPNVSWGDANSKVGDIKFGQPLSASQLNASVTPVANGVAPAGGFTKFYTPDFGTYLTLPLGAKTLHLDVMGTLNYSYVGKDVSVNLIKGNMTFELLSPGSIPLNQNPTTFSGKVVLPGGSGFVPAGDNVTIQLWERNASAPLSGKTASAPILADGTFSASIDTSGLSKDKSPYLVKWFYDTTSSPFNDRIVGVTNDTFQLTYAVLVPTLTAHQYQIKYGTRTALIEFTNIYTDPITKATTVPPGLVTVNFNGKNYVPTSGPDANGKQAVTVSLLKNNAADVNDLTQEGLNATTYTVTYKFNNPGGTAPDGNYSQYSTPRSDIVITPRPLVVNWTGTSTYGTYINADTKQIVAGSTQYNGDGLAFNDATKISVVYDVTPVTLTRPAGVYHDILPGTPNDSGSGKLANYSYTLNPGTLTVGKAPLTLTAKATPGTIRTNEPLPALSYSYDAAQLKNGETIGQIGLTPTPKVITSAANTATKGDYDLLFETKPITSPNYAIQTVDSASNAGIKLHIIWDIPVIVWGSLAGITYGDKLGDTQLNAVVQFHAPGSTTMTNLTADDGTLAYTIAGGAPAKDAYLSAGDQRQVIATFTPKQRLIDAGFPASVFTPYVNFINVKPKSLLATPISFTFNINDPADTLDVNNMPFRYAGWATIGSTTESEATPGNVLTSPTFKAVDSQGAPANKAVANTYNVVQATAGSFSPNYSISYGSGTYKIVGLPTYFKWVQDKQLTYGTPVDGAVNDAQAYTDSALTSPLPGGSWTFTYPTADNKVLAVGKYNMTASFTPPGNYTGGTTNNTLTVNKKNLFVYVNYNTNRVYGTANPTDIPLIPTATNNYAILFTNVDGTIGSFIGFPPDTNNNYVILNGFVNGENFTSNFNFRININANDKANVGNNSVIEVAGQNLGNYSLKYDTSLGRKGVLTVTPRTMTINLANARRLYGQKNDTLPLTPTVTPTPNPDNISALVINNTDTNTPAGTYPLAINIVDPNARLFNYNYTINGGQQAYLSIDPAPLSVAVTGPSGGAVVRKKNTDNPDFSKIVTFSGFVNGENNKSGDPKFVAVNGLTITTTATKTSPTGNYDIIATGGKAANYQLNTDPGPLKVGVLTITENRAPVANPDSFLAQTNDVTKILISKLLSNDSDPDGDTITLDTFSATTTKGGTIMLDNTGLWLLYLPYAGAAINDRDTFTYRIKDTDGATGSTTVYLTIKGSTLNVVPKNIVSARQNSDGSFFLRFSGITGRAYKIQASTTFLNPTWVDLPVNTTTVNQVPANGSVFPVDTNATPAPGTINPTKNTITANDAGFVEYTDVDAPNAPSRFYRAVSAQ